MNLSNRSWLVPAASFLIAVALAFAAGPTRRVQARSAQEPTGPQCAHDPFTVPGINAKACVQDGQAEPVVAPTTADFDPVAEHSYFSQLRCVVKSKDGSITANARRKRELFTDNAGGSQVTVDNESNTAQVGLKLTQGSAADCCHGVTIDGVGNILFRLRVDGPLPFGTSGTAKIGSESNPVRFSIKAVYDQNCNGLEDSLENVVILSAEVDCRRDQTSRPITCIFTGYMEGKFREVVDNNGVESIPTRVEFDSLVQRGNGLERIRERPIGFNDLGKAFPSTTTCTVDISKVNLSAKAQRDLAAKPFPVVFADLGYNTEDLTEVDTDEIKIAQLKKDP